MLLLLLAGTAAARGTLTENIRIKSDVLEYDLQYRVYLPQAYDGHHSYPVLFLTDGQDYLAGGHMQRILDRLIGRSYIKPVIAVFVDSRDPDKRSSNRRFRQFLCNVDYLRFFTDELIPSIEQHYSVVKNRDGRTIMGFSYGGTNAACFGLMGYEFFSGIAMQSPANHIIPKLLPAYQKKGKLPLKVFLSTGKPNDNTAANRKFHRALTEEGYDMKYVEVIEGHNWDNWRPLLDDALLYFYGTNDK